MQKTVVSSVEQGTSKATKSTDKAERAHNETPSKSVTNVRQQAAEFQRDGATGEALKSLILCSIGFGGLFVVLVVGVILSCKHSSTRTRQLDASKEHSLESLQAMARTAGVPAPFFLGHADGCTYRISVVGHQLLFLNLGIAVTDESVAASRKAAQYSNPAGGLVGGLAAGLSQVRADKSQQALDKQKDSLNRLQFADQSKLHSIAGGYKGSFFVDRTSLNIAKMNSPSVWSAPLASHKYYAALVLEDKERGKMSLYLPSMKDVFEATKSVAKLRPDFEQNLLQQQAAALGDSRIEIKPEMVLVGTVFIFLAGFGFLLWFTSTQSKAPTSHALTSHAPTSHAEPTLGELRAQHKTVLTANASAPQNYDNTPPNGVEVVYFPSGGKKLMAWLAVPAGKYKHPAVLFAHGGFALGAEDFEQVKPFLSSGFAVLMPAWRGENGNPGAFEMCYGEVADAAAALDYLSKDPRIDKSNLFAAGHSIGGTIVMLLAETSPKLRKAAACGGYPNMSASGAYRGDSFRPPFNEFDGQELALRSPARYTKDLSCPLLLCFGESDPGDRHFASQARSMQSDAQSSAKAVTIEEIPNADHFTALQSAIPRMISFFLTN